MARTPDETKKPKAPAKTATKAPAKPRAVAAKTIAKAKPAPKTGTAKAKPVAAKPRATAAKGTAVKTPAKPAPRTSATVRATPKAAAKTAAPKATAAKPSAKPRAAPKRVKKVPMPLERLERIVAAARKSLEDDKAENVVVLDVTSRASYADRLIIATGLADRQIQAMATHVDQALAEEGLKLRRDAVQSSEDWVLIDAGDLVIHLFKPEAREKFDLEKMWGPDSPLGEAGPGEQSPI